MSNDAAGPADEPVGATGAPGEGAKVSFGEFLRRERLRCRLTLDETAHASRVPVRYLEAMEDEDFDSLPPKIYVRGYLEAVGRKLSVPAGDLLRRYEESLNAQRRQRREEGAIFALFRPQGEAFHWRDWMIPLLISLAVLSFSLGRRLLDAEEVPPAPPAPPAMGKEETVLPRETFFRADRKEGEREGPARPAAVRVVVRAEATTWLEKELDGGEKEEWTMRAGEIRVLEAEKTVVLSLGNAGGVRLNHNDRELGFIGRKGEVKRGLVFTADEE